MKKNVFICILFCTVILLTGCAQNNQNNKNNNYTATRSNYNAGEKDNDIVQNSQITEEEIVSTFSTKIYDKSEGRMNNLRIASQKLTGKIVNAGSTFSFNDEIGPYNKENGFEKGKIFSSTGDVLEEYGGGICQISTTLYNSLLPLNVEIIERHKHSKKVQYIENGKDATLSYGHLDFKFKNTTNYDIEFICQVSDNEVTIQVKKKG